MKAGGKKHFKYEELSSEYFVPSGGGVMLHYLECMKKDLADRDKRGEQETAFFD